MANNEYVLAMYDVRGKQEYIYRSRHIKEIMGGSAVIEDIFKDYLYPSAIAYRAQLNNTMGDAIYFYKNVGSEENFRVSDFENRMSGSQYLGEVVYEGGGNFFVLYKNEGICKGINRIFTRKVLEETQTLMVLCTCVKVGAGSGNIGCFDNYKEDRDLLYEEHKSCEATHTPYMPDHVLPFTQIDKTTSLPLCRYYDIVKTKKREKVSQESLRKYEKYETIKGKSIKFDEKFLDNLATKKGEESLLAIIYADGNNMGAKVKKLLSGKTGYEECVNALRSYSSNIQKTYIDDQMQKMDQVLTQRYPGKKMRRAVIGAGDEITIICNVRDAFAIAESYLKTLPDGFTSCAGIAIFHSHAPFADVYRIAEECCESGKKLMKKENWKDAQLIDFHFCQSGIGTSLEHIREKESGSLISKPWYVKKVGETKPSDKRTSDGKRLYDTDEIKILIDEMNKVSRTNLKGLLSDAKKSLASLNMERARINAHSEQKIDFLLSGTYTDDEIRELLIDILGVYDLWFRPEK